MSNSQFHSHRILPFARSQVFAAHRDSAILSTWWGPVGFTNTFHEFDFREGGRWHFTMHGPDGGNYDNVWIFLRIVPNECIEMRHDCAPYFSMTITLTDVPDGTHVDWLATFDDAKVSDALFAMIMKANEENFDRLETAISKLQP